MEFKDYYKTLGVEPDASADDIRKAYRKLARKYHPDRNKESGSEDRFKEVGEAYEVLKDPEKRKQYDQLRAGGWRGGENFEPPPGWTGGVRGAGRQARGGQGFSDFGDFSDFFETLFGGGLGGMGGGRGAGARRQARAKGRDITASVEIDLDTAFHGGKRRITLDRDGQRQNLDVNIPAGVTPGRKIRLSGQGEPGIGGGPSGDLYMEVNIAPHPLFRLEGRDIHIDLPIAPWEAALGAEVRVPTLGGKVTTKIPAGSSSGKRLRLKGRGLPGKPAGDQIVNLKVDVPKPKTDRERELYRELAEESGTNVREKM
ncbi:MULTISPECIES: DnaJ C-terminal domain-containing protein [unclassified Wenzhouxiangella]|uniref:DnaJ C-terminal domain-containing protein n=1 Tax=unclassified Wenzhouxiangella TaxID=2613841 RepID=UPI000E32C38F|nr:MULTISPECIES: DnaJ C-terminal domain-containing protein [unclassified Wenzhouxiangella]RFF27661.1 J domain-containing protein [Wenzhouxiangella sp. 15181]RFP69753.1 J domain-containing protein [Wenzhouxiangella sp. 15190]